MALGSYYYTNSAKVSDYEREMMRQQQRYLEEMARRENPLRNGLNDVFEGQRRAIHAQEASKPKLNKVLLLCS